MLKYREDFGLYWPDFDQKAERNYAFIMEHLTDMDFAIEKAKDNQVCIQAGGNAGIWPDKLANHFRKVYTFEPEIALFKCMELNIKKPNVEISQKALSNEIGETHFHRSSSCGSNRITETGALTIQTITIDSLDFPACDAIFLDVEGHELQAIQGAVNTISKFKPVIQVEWLKHYECELNVLTHLLADLGYKTKQKVRRDMVFLPL